MGHLIYSPLSRRDLSQIWDYIAAHNTAAADRVLREIDAQCRQLARSPELGECWPQLAPDVRMLTVGRYAVFYRSIADGIEVARIIHSARDIPGVFGNS
jgi:toxin ParE1/3/4